MEKTIFVRMVRRRHDDEEKPFILNHVADVVARDEYVHRAPMMGGTGFDRQERDAMDGGWNRPARRTFAVESRTFAGKFERQCRQWEQPRHGRN